MVKLVYYSKTGNTRRYVKKVGWPDTIEIDDGMCNIEDEFILVVPTYEASAVQEVIDFMDDDGNAGRCIGVLGGGNLNFGKDLYGITSKEIGRKYNVPVLRLFEFTGDRSDVEYLSKLLKSKSEEVK